MSKTNHKKNYYDKLLVAAHDIQEYIIYSEMEGELDDSDPWFSLWSSLRELSLKMQDEKEFDKMTLD